jgi:hypothetical protein
MSLDIPARAVAPAPYPLQFINIEITPLTGGEYSVVMQATLLDEEELGFVGQDLANAHVDTIDEALAIIRSSVQILAGPSTAAPAS